MTKLKPDRAELIVTYGRHRIEVTTFKRGWTGAKLHLERPEDKPLRMQFDRSRRDEAGERNQALSSPKV